MKKLYTLILFICASLFATAQTTFTISSADSQTKNGITISFDKAAGSTGPTVYNDQLRLYASNTIVVTGSNITSISLYFTKQGSKAYATLSADKGKLTSGGTSESNSDVKCDTWTGNSTGATFTLGSTGQRIITKIEVFTDGEGPGTGGGNIDDEVTFTNIDYAEASIEDGQWQLLITNDKLEYPWFTYFFEGEVGKISGTYKFDASPANTSYGIFWLTDDEEEEYQFIMDGTLIIAHIGTDFETELPVYRYIYEGTGEDGITYKFTSTIPTYLSIYEAGETEEDDGNFIDIESEDPIVSDPIASIGSITTSEAAIKDGKRIENGRILIKHGNHCYSIKGQRIRK